MEYSLETKKLGTGGALKKAAKMCTEQIVYAMNVDDILLGDYNPADLINYADKGGAIVIAKPKLQFGRVKTEDGLITGFEHKPRLEFNVSAGHYAFMTETILKHFPEEGNFESQTSPKLASLRMLRSYPFDGLWLTINTIKELSKAREYFKRD